jgi:hypothetical protein
MLVYLVRSGWAVRRSDSATEPYRCPAVAPPPPRRRSFVAAARALARGRHCHFEESVEESDSSDHKITV